jgi:hypothetical protein
VLARALPKRFKFCGDGIASSLLPISKPGDWYERHSSRSFAKLHPRALRVRIDNLLLAFQRPLISVSTRETIAFDSGGQPGVRVEFLTEP